MLDIRSSDFKNYLQTLVGNEQEFKILNKPEFQYHGTVELLSFEISENQRALENTSNSVLAGKIIEHGEAIEVQVESVLLGPREYLFAFIGFALIIIGLYNLLFGSFSDENLTITLFGLFCLAFTIYYMRVDADRAIKHFTQTIQDIQLRYKS